MNIINNYYLVSIKNTDSSFTEDLLLIKKNIKKSNYFIFISHDQVLIPFKYIDNNLVINYTWGLIIIKISADNQTIYNSIGKKVANFDSLLNDF